MTIFEYHTPLSDSKHILFISSWYPNRNNPFHGIFNRAFVDAAALNHKVSVIHVCSDPNLKTDYEIIEQREENIFTITIYYKKIESSIPILSQFLKKQKLIRFYDLGFNIVKEKVGKPDLIQLNVVLPAGIGAKYLSDKYKIPFVINECWTGYMPADGNYKGLATKYFTKKIVSRAKTIMPVSESLQQNMLAHGLNGNYRVVPNVVDINVFKPNPSIQKPTNKTRLIHISTFDQDQKNVTGILNAFENAYKVEQSLELTFVGNLNNAKSLMKLIDKKNLLGAVQIKNSMPKESLINEINTHHAMIMFSNYESFCLVLAEAMACGLPVITSICGGLTDIVPDYAGLKVEPGNEQQLTEAILALNKTNYDPEKIRLFIADQYSQSTISKKLTNVYNDVLKN